MCPWRKSSRPARKPHMPAIASLSSYALNFSCRDFHREQLALERSMQDLDSAVSRLDSILITVYIIISGIIIAICLVSCVSLLLQKKKKT